MIQNGVPHVDFWQGMIDNHGKADLQGFLSKYQAGVDFPIGAFPKEMYETFPNAKFILTVRDPVKWYVRVCASLVTVTTLDLNMV